MDEILPEDHFRCTICHIVFDESDTYWKAPCGYCREPHCRKHRVETSGDYDDGTVCHTCLRCSICCTDRKVEEIESCSLCHKTCCRSHNKSWCGREDCSRHNKSSVDVDYTEYSDVMSLHGSYSLCSNCFPNRTSLVPTICYHQLNDPSFIENVRVRAYYLYLNGAGVNGSNSAFDDWVNAFNYELARCGMTYEQYKQSYLYKDW
jgi:hypothetical protein